LKLLSDDVKQQKLLNEAIKRDKRRIAVGWVLLAEISILLSPHVAL